MAVEHIDPYPWFLNKNLDLVVNDQLVHTRITATEWADHWRPLLGRLLQRFEATFPKRLLIAIGGPPGAGKSVLAQQLHWIIDRRFFHSEAHSIALPMDGFHFSNDYLATHKRRLPDGTEIPLSTVKGAPDTFDIASLRRHIQALVARPESVTWPGYSRISHDVIPEKYHIVRPLNVVIIEGNYLLVNRSLFAGLPDLFDLRLYVDAPAPHIIATLVERHIKGGKSLDEAKDWVKRIDLPNARVAEASKPNADVIIERDTDQDLASVTWKGEAPTINTKTSGIDTAATQTLVAPHLPPTKPPAT